MIYSMNITMKPVDVKSNTYVDFNNEIDNKDLKFKFSDTVKI